MTSRFAAVAVLFFAMTVLTTSCSTNEKKDGSENTGLKKLRMATTTSTENSGLLEAIFPDFEKKTGIKVDVIAVGTGKALKLGENGDVDILMVHAPEAEKEFITAGFGTERTVIMYNDFVIAGSESDPAGISGKDTAAALKRIFEKKQPFISRGDDSGTHKKEMQLWAAAGVFPDGDWYMEVGRGMGATLITAEEKQAYTLTDRGTYLSMADKLTIFPLVEGGPELMNIYSVIPVAPEKNPHVRIDHADEFLHWISSPDTKKMIADFRVGGKQLFHPINDEGTVLEQ